MLALTGWGIGRTYSIQFYQRGQNMNWLAESIVVLWFLPVVLFIVIPLVLTVCHLGMGALNGVFGQKADKNLLITKRMGAGA